MESAQIAIPLLLTFLAGISTGIGSLFSLFVKDFNKKILRFSLGLSAGVMIYISFVELLAKAIQGIGFLTANVSFFTGIVFIMFVDFLIPHEYIEEHAKGDPKDRKILAAGILTALGIGIHNFPEGIAVFMTSMGDLQLGIPIACAIAMHNIPEGIAVAMPIYYATQSRKKAFWYSFGSGIAEPVGALVAAAVLMPFLNPVILDFLLAFVAGIMVFISFDELLPLSYAHEGEHVSILGVVLGMVIMALSLYFLR